MQKKYPQIIFCVYLSLITAMLFSCNPSHRADRFEHPKLTDSILNEAKLLPDSDRLNFVNAAYKKFKPGARDKLKRYSFLFDYYTSQKDHYKAAQYGDSMIAVIKPIADIEPAYQDDLMQAYFLKGDAELALHKFEAAFTMYDKANDLQTLRNGAVKPFFDYNMRLANAFYKQGNYKQAISFFKLASADEQDDEKPWLVFTYTQALKDNIGLSFCKLGQIDSALHYFDQALNYITKNEVRFSTNAQKIYIKVARGIIYGNKATALVAAGQTAEAEKLFYKDIELTRDNYGEEDGEISREKLAMLYLKQHDTKRVLKMLDTIRTWAIKPGYQSHKQRYLKILAGVYAQAGDYRKAHDANEQLLRLNDSIAKEEESHFHENFERLIAYKHNVDQITQLNKEKQNDRLLLAANIVSLVLTVLVVVLLWQNYRKYKQTTVQLKALNEQIHLKNVELAGAFDDLAHSYQVNSRITKTVAHDLRAPLMAMRTFIQLMGSDKIPAHEKDVITKLIHTNCTDSLSLIEDMLNNNAADLLDLAPVKIDEMLKHCILQERERYKEKKQHVAFKPTQATVLADAEKLRRVFCNLLINAIKFTGDNGKIKVLMNVVDNNVIVSIVDDGIGIPADMHEKLFDITVNTKRPGTANEPSHGLGLFICRQIIEAHDGKIWFSSNVAKGAIVNVMLRVHLS